MALFVVLEHDHPQLHWDLMLEVGEVLWTWRLAGPPTSGQVVAGVRTFDHRRVYLDYEGPISGNRGSVKRYDRGEYDWLERAPESLSVLLRGQCLAGRLCLRCLGGDDWQAELNPEESIPQEGEHAG
jgi:hypothetical protein